MICRMNGVHKVIASAIATTHLSFSLGTFQIQLQVADLLQTLESSFTIKMFIIQATGVKV
jgi:hypothetical protein